MENTTTKTLLASTLGVAIIASYAATHHFKSDLFSGISTFIDAVTPFDTADDAEKNVGTPPNTRHHYHQRLAARLATGEGAGGVVAVDANYVGAFVDAGRFENLSDAPFDIASLAEGRADQTWQKGQDAEGNQYAIPVNVGPRVMYYRRDILAASGTDIDDVVVNWDAYIAFGRALKDQGVFLVGDAADAADVIINASLQDGEGRYFDTEGNSLLTSERFVSAFQTARTIREEGLDGQISAWSTEWYEAFTEGTIATQMSGAWLFGHLQSWMPLEAGDLLAASHLPDGLQGTSGDSFFAIPKGAENKQAAWGFIKYLIDVEEATGFGPNIAGACSVVKAPLEAGAVDATLASYPSQATVVPISTGPRGAAAATPSVRDLIAKDIIDAALADVLDNGKNITTALAEADSHLALALQ